MKERWNIAKECAEKEFREEEKKEKEKEKENVSKTETDKEFKMERVLVEVEAVMERGKRAVHQIVGGHQSRAPSNVSEDRDVEELLTRVRVENDDDDSADVRMCKAQEEERLLINVRDS